MRTLGETIKSWLSIANDAEPADECKSLEVAHGCGASPHESWLGFVGCLLLSCLLAATVLTFVERDWQRKEPPR